MLLSHRILLCHVRMVPEDMDRPAGSNESEDMTVTYKASRAHNRAMNSTNLPRNAAAVLASKLLHSNVNSEDSEFIEAHLLACERLMELDEYSDCEPRRLHSLSLAPAFLYLLAGMLEAADNPKTTGLCVEALNSKEHIYTNNLFKSEEIINEGMKIPESRKRKVTEVEEEDEAIDVGTLDDKLEKLLGNFRR